MKKRKLWIPLFALVVMLCMQLTVCASAAELEFQDVSANSPWYEGITYAAENGITCGTGNNCFSPDNAITVRQWAVMICRAYEKEVPATSDSSFGLAEIDLAYKEGWLNMTAMLDPDTKMCRSAVYASAFAAEGVPVYQYDLYNDGEEISQDRNYIRVSCENGLCEEDADPLELITRGEAVQIIYLIRTNGLHVELPEMLEQYRINNVDQVYLEPYLLELKKIPEPILKEYEKRGWSFRVDDQYLEQLSKKLNMQCAGATSYQEKTIYARVSSCTIHEFGHFYHLVLGFPSTINALYEKESASACGVLGDYSTTNSKEYFAEFFEYWINWNGHESRMRFLQEAAPDTYSYFLALESGGWTNRAAA